MRRSIRASRRAYMMYINGVNWPSTIDTLRQRCSDRHGDRGANARVAEPHRLDGLMGALQHTASQPGALDQAGSTTANANPGRARDDCLEVVIP